MHLQYLVAAYIVIWVATFVYVGTLTKRQSDVLKQIKQFLKSEN